MKHLFIAVITKVIPETSISTTLNIHKYKWFKSLTGDSVINNNLESLANHCVHKRNNTPRDKIS